MNRARPIAVFALALSLPGITGAAERARASTPKDRPVVHVGPEEAVGSPGEEIKESLEESMYVPPKLGEISLPVYPFELLREGVKGEAAVNCLVDTDGVVVQTHVLRATRPEFAASMVAALEATRFAYATREGEPIATVFPVRYSFDPDGKANKDLLRELGLLEQMTRRPGSLGRARDLDQPLRVVSQPAPAFPRELFQRRVEGEVTVEFLVDVDGRPRLPRVLRTSDPKFGYAAVHAVSRWRFDPPMCKGRPAVLRVIAPFSFRL